MESGISDEEITIDGDTDRFDCKEGGCGAWGEGALPHKRGQRGHILQLEGEVWGLSASELHRLRETEVELGKLKRMYADLALENRALKDLLEKKLEGRRRNGKQWGT